MSDPIPTVPLDAALDAPAPDGVVPGPVPTMPAASAVRTRFVKTMCPGVPVSIPGREDIVFHIPKNNQTGELASYGYYDAVDPDEIAALRALPAVLFVRET